jgi:glycosyltransferase involved in cell wall biosynthesis
MDWRNIRYYNHNHKIVFPNKTDSIHVAEEFRAKPRHVKVIPHIKDLRTWFDFGEDTCDFIAEFPDVMTSDIVQVYPASSDRLSSKGLKQIVLLLSKMKRMGFSVFLVIANQWAHGRGGTREDVGKYENIARRNGLKMYEDFVFTSEYNNHYELGLPKRMLRELFQCSNLFVFPTQGESFGLIGPEAALSGGVLLVLNKSLPMMTEVYGHTGVYFDFGSLVHDLKVDNEKAYYDRIAGLIINRMTENEAIASKTYVRKKYNWYNIYNRYYEPIMAESVVW